VAAGGEGKGRDGGNWGPRGPEPTTEERFVKRVRILAVAAALAKSLLGASPALAGPEIPNEIPGGSPPIWDRCGLPGSGC